uniref:Putative reverse transcriptase domain-containing protein n=1 Tax=Tanacetum cinerariifolium TaxID=118510 RepID=A0A6L2LT21_TANCI|nr:putative reverse transcriptase domain-containing protein [Tanacetum cinerariifolium]
MNSGGTMFIGEKYDSGCSDLRDYLVRCVEIGCALCGDYMCGYHPLSRVCPIVNAPAGRLLDAYDLGVGNPRAVVHADDKTSGDARSCNMISEDAKCVLIKVNGWFWRLKMCTLGDLGFKTKSVVIGVRNEMMVECDIDSSWQPNVSRDKKCEWGEEQEEPFQTLKDNLCITPILTLPDEPDDFVMERREDGGLYFMDRISFPLMGNVRTLIMDKAYSTRYSVHHEADKMYHDLRDMYWWSGIKKNIAIYVTYGVPAGLYRKALKRKRRRKMLKKGGCGGDNDVDGDRSSCDGEELLIGERVFSYGVVTSLEVDSDVMRFEDEMWGKFYGTGFWRSASQRVD